MPAACRNARSRRACRLARRRRATAFGGRGWPGAAIADWSWSPAAKDRPKREEYLLIQLRTAADLVAETRAMHHCVASYATKCISGHASIWSLRRRAAGNTERLLTIDLDRQYWAIQVRVSPTARHLPRIESSWSAGPRRAGSTSHNNAPRREAARVLGQRGGQHLSSDGRVMVQTSDRRTKTIPSVAMFHTRERSRKTPAAYKAR